MGVVSALSEKVLPFGIPLRFDFPPTHLIEAPPAGAFDVEDLERRTRRLEKLENLYHKGQDAAWDGRAVLAELVERHGGVHADAGTREAISEIFTIILWGELAAWEVAAYLSEHVRDHAEVKMAATIQTFDEARHYYVMRDYLRLLEVGLPQPNGFVKTILSQVLATDSLLYKIVGMQLFVEHVAVHLFRVMADAKVEPVLADLMPYFQRDEARHVALGKLYLPVLLSRLSRREALDLMAYQLWLGLFMQLSIEYHREHAETIGIDIQDGVRQAMRDQTAMLEEIAAHAGVRGLLLTPKRLRFLNRWMLENLWGAEREGGVSFLNRERARTARRGAVRVAERAWRLVA